MHVTQYWKQVVGGRMQYTRVVVPRGQEQPLPRGARKITREAYEEETAEQSATDARSARSRDSLDEKHVLTGDMSAVVDELSQLGLSEGTIDTLTGGRSRA